MSVIGEGKYAKYIVKGKHTSHEILGRKSGKTQGVQLFSFDDHDEAPFYTEAFVFIKGDEYAVQAGNQIEYPPTSWIGQIQARTGLKWFLYPHVHPFLERYHVMSLDPDDVENLGGTMQVWVNDANRVPELAENAELYELKKPCIMVLPENMRHGPLNFVDMKRTFFFLLVAESKAYRRVSNWRPGEDHLYPPSIDYVTGDGAEKWRPKPQSEAVKNKREYAHLYKELDPYSWMPAPRLHKGKSRIIHHATWKDHPQVRSRVECHLITGGGIGFGCGDNEQFPPCPMKNSAWSTLAFYSTDPDLPGLGGKVEVWIGEGANAEKYIVDETVTFIIPPATVHYPIYVHECTRPFVMATIIDEPLFGGKFVDVYPPGFQYQVPDKRPPKDK
jgi:hypothetical protein